MDSRAGVAGRTRGWTGDDVAADDRPGSSGTGTGSGRRGRDARADYYFSKDEPKTLRETLTFFNKDVETTFHIWMSQNSRDLALRMHFLLILGWFVGWLQSSSVLLAQGENRSVRVVLVSVIQLSVVIHEALQVKKLLSNNIELQAQQHAVKAKMHAFLHLTTISMIIICSQALFDSRWHTLSTIFLTCLSIGDQLPLYHLVKLQMIKLACFGILLFVRLCVDRSSPHLALLLGDTLMLLMMGTIVPLGVAALVEYRQRIVFLRNMNERPSHLLGTFWRLFQWFGP